MIVKTQMLQRSTGLQSMAALLGSVWLLGALTCAAAAAPQAAGSTSALQGPPGVTSVSGRIVDGNGAPLPGVRLLVGASHTKTDAQGRFLLSYVIPGQGVLQIDGQHAGTKRLEDHGFYEVGIETKTGQTTVLPYTSWLPLIDHAHDVDITFPTRAPVVVANPALPGVELHIPANVEVRDVDGKKVKKISITPMPKDRTPLPLPRDFDLPLFYTIQPGAACLYGPHGQIGTAQIYYPNSQKELPRARATFWRYEPDANGWTSHGTGTVSDDGQRIVPDADTVITDFGSAECNPRTRTRQQPLQRIDASMLRKFNHGK
jgi:hypothetical protein